MSDAPACPVCTPTGATICARCLRRIERALGDLPGLVAALDDTVARRTAGASIVRRPRSEHPLPFADGRHIDEARACVAILSDWAQHIAGVYPSGVDDAHRTFAAAVLLMGRLDWFGTSDEAATAAQAVLQIRDKLRRAIDRPASRVYAGPCGAEIVELTVDHAEGVLTPRLDTTTCHGAVYAEPGDPLALCTSCRIHHHVKDRRDAILVELEHDLLPLRTILDVLPVLTGHNPAPATVRQWRHRRRLIPAGVDSSGRDLYRGGDVLRLAAHAPKGIPA